MPTVGHAASDPAARRSAEHTAIVLWLAAIGLALLRLQTTLPPHGFAAGDPGVKLISTFEAIAHPERPTQIDLPRVAGTPLPAMERFFQQHGDHAHALQSPLFPLLSAPVVALGGLRAAYLLPAASFIAFTYFSYLLAVFGGSRKLVAAVVVTAASPLFFYALEFWEHVPAAACLAASTWLALREQPRERLVAAGAISATACLLRPEGIWYVAGIFVALRDVRRASLFALAAASILSVYAAANLAEGAPVLGFHAAANLATLSDSWLTARGERAAAWFGLGAWPVVLGFSAIALSWAGRGRIGSKGSHEVVALLGALIVGVAGATGSAGGTDSIWRAWTIGAVVAVPRSRTTRELRLWLVLGIAATGVVLTSTHNGGAQWGPRILLICSPLLAALSAVAVSSFLAQGPTRAPASAALVLALLACGAWSTRAVYLDLRSTKRYYARLVDAVGSAAPPGSLIVTNLWWLDQIAASLHPSRQFLYVEDAGQAAGVMSAASRDAGATVVLAWSDDSSEPGNLLGWMRGTCYRATWTRRVPERMVELAGAVCDASP